MHSVGQRWRAGDADTQRDLEMGVGDDAKHESSSGVSYCCVWRAPVRQELNNT